MIMMIMIIIRRKGKTATQTAPCTDYIIVIGLRIIFGSSGAEWCISSMLYSRDIPFWSGPLEMSTVRYVYKETGRWIKQTGIAMSRNSRWLLALCVIDQYDECVQRNRKMDKTDGDSYVKE